MLVKNNGQNWNASINAAELVFEDYVVPADNLVGEAGDSLIHMMRNLEIERVALAAMSLGIAAFT